MPAASCPDMACPPQPPRLSPRELPACPQLGLHTPSHCLHCTPRPPARFLLDLAPSCVLPVGKPFSSSPLKPPLKPADLSLRYVCSFTEIVLLLPIASEPLLSRGGSAMLCERTWSLGSDRADLEPCTCPFLPGCGAKNVSSLSQFPHPSNGDRRAGRLNERLYSHTRQGQCCVDVGGMAGDNCVFAVSHFPRGCSRHRPRSLRMLGPSSQQPTPCSGAALLLSCLAKSCFS